MRPAMTQKQQVHRKATSDAMKRLAKARTCPKCERGAALKRIDFGEVVIYLCRYCGHEHSYEKQLGK